MSSHSLDTSVASEDQSDLPLAGLRASWSRLVFMSIVVALLAAIVAWAVDHSDLVSAFRLMIKNPLLIGAFFIAYTAAFGLRSEAWRQLLPGLDRMTAFSALQTSLFANHVLPVKAGEIVRPYISASRGLTATRSISTSVVARIIDYICLFVLASILIPLAPSSPVNGFASLMISGVMLAAGVSVLIAIRSVPPPAKVPAVVERTWRSAKHSIAQISPRQTASAFVLTLPSWILESAAILVSAEAIGVDIGIQAAIAVTSFTLLFQIFHFAPGGIGVYEASMTGALAFYGVSIEQAIVLAVVTHGIKFAYSYSFAGLFAGGELLRAIRPDRTHVSLDKSRAREASRFEIISARVWNVLNEGKPFTPVFTVGVLILINLPQLGSIDFLTRSVVSAIALIPLGIVFYRFDFPLHLRWALWAFLGLFVAVFQVFDFVAIAIAVGLYLTFTIVLWGTVYYHIRIGMPWTNFTRFWKLVLENPDPTSGNFFEQTPKYLLLVLMFSFLMESPGSASLLAAGAFTLIFGITALLLHQWFFTWVPALPISPTRTRVAVPQNPARRVIVIAIDGCRADRLLEANTPFIDDLRAQGTDFSDMRTVYPARTVTAFSSMLTGAPPDVHGMKSNFVPSLGVKCESIFDVLEEAGKTGKLVGIAHLVDAFGEEVVDTVSAVNHNDAIDYELVSQAKRVMKAENPELLVLQLLSVDQTGHARGSYNDEYLAKIEETDRIVEEFVTWCHSNGFMDDTRLIITSDHGQGKGIGGHGHLTESERRVPFIAVGQDIGQGQIVHDAKHLTDVAPTILQLLGHRAPRESVGEILVGPASDSPEDQDPVAVIIPAYNEVGSLPETLRRISREEVSDLRVIVVDDGSTDATSEVAREFGADIVVQHDRNRGLGAALRTGLAEARNQNARAAIYLDADGEYDPTEIPVMLNEVESGRADYVLGVRHPIKGEKQKLPRRVGNRVFTTLLSIAAGRRIQDGQTGFRAFSRRALGVAEIVHDYNYAQVLTLDLLRKGMAISEVPVSWKKRRRGNSFINWQYLWRVPIGMAREMWNA